jgi:hypothetical protein
MSAMSLLEDAKSIESRGQVLEADSLYASISDGIDRSLGIAHQNYIAVLSSWGGMLIRQGQLKKALTVCQEALAAARRLQPADRELLTGLTANVRLIETQLAEQRSG